MNLKEKFFDIFNMYVEKKSSQKKISKTLKKLLAKTIPFFSFNKVYIGSKADVSAPSAVILRNKFGNLNAIIKMSECIPAPKKEAKKTSLINPVIRLRNVIKAVCLKPLINSEDLFFI